MAHRVIKQPNGKLALFSTVVDDFIVIDATVEDIVKLEVESAEASIREEITKELERNHTTDWDDCLEAIKTVHGRRRVTKILTIIGDISCGPKPQ